MSDWNQGPQGQGQTPKGPGQGQQGQGQGQTPKSPGQGSPGQAPKSQNYGPINQSQGTQTQGGPGAWVWLRWNEDAPKNAWQEIGNTDYESWHCDSGDWNCKVWVPAKTENEAKQFVDTKFKNNKWIKDSKLEWNWNQRNAA